MRGSVIPISHISDGFLVAVTLLGLHVGGCWVSSHFQHFHGQKKKKKHTQDGRQIITHAEEQRRLPPHGGSQVKSTENKFESF